MAEYAANILKTDALYYRLSGATLRNGVLHLNAGGSAETTITTQQLTVLTENFRVSYIATRFCDSYESNIRIYVFAKDVDGNCFNYTFFPVDVYGNLYMQEFQVKGAKYSQLVWRVESDVSVDISLWELCPEAEDINTQTIIDGISQSLPRLLYDYNTWPLTIENIETTVGIITFQLMDKTDLQGHFLMSFYASDAAILTLRFYSGEIQELFSPLTYDIRKGYNSIGVPHSYLHRSAGHYTIMVTAQVTSGIVTVPTRGVLFSIDGGYLAKRELDLAMDVQDMAIRQRSESFGPDEIWLVGLDAGEVLVRKRDYNETNPNVSWTAVKSLGQGLGAAIEFDGSWVLRAHADRYTIETDEFPWYFWIDPDNVLWAQYGDDETTLFQVDTQVTQVKACRGYSSIIYLEQDQGLVVAYIKNNHVYYRQYQYQTGPGEKQWLDPQIVYGSEEFDTVNIHRLNDYRLSFELSNSAHNIWMYTPRNYVGQSVAPEKEYLPDSQAPECIANYPRDYDTSIQVLEVLYEPGDLDLYITYNRLFHLANYIRIEDCIQGIDLLVYDPYDEDRNNVKKVEWLPDEITHTTTLHIVLKNAIVPSKLIYQVGIVLNYNNNPYFWVVLDDWGYAIFTAISASRNFDNTNYIYTTQQEGYRLPEANPGITYRALGHYKGREIDIYNLPEATANLVYTRLGHLKNRNLEEYIAPEAEAVGVAYYDKHGKPI